MSISVRPFLMFEGRAEEAMRFYTSLIPGSEIIDIVYFDQGQSGESGSVMKAVFSIGGQKVMCTDSPIKHDFTFTPSFSLFIECESEQQIRNLAVALAEGGKLLMPLDNYGFSTLFIWLSDRFGVSWQINLQ